MAGIQYNQSGVIYNDPAYTYAGLSTATPIVPPPNPYATGFPVRPGIGWEFFLLHPGGNTEPIYLSTTGNYTFDLTRSVTRAIDGFLLTPEEFVKVDLIRDKVLGYLAIDGVAYPMGVFRFTESTRQVDAVRGAPDGTGNAFGVTYGATAGVTYGTTGIPYASVTLINPGYYANDLHNVALADIMTDLVRNDGSAETLRTGFDPSQEMQRILQQDGLPYAIAGTSSPSKNDVTWDGSATDLDKITSLAQLAGHLNPWSDNRGIVRSVSASTDSLTPTALDDLQPQAESIVITETFLTAPNRIIVSDSGSADQLIQGQWDAPAIAPHSHARLGYYRTQMMDVQGLGSNAHAADVAAALGRQATARKLDCTIKPTNLLDGPVTVSFRGSNWMCVAWTVSTEANSTMSITLQEIT